MVTYDGELHDAVSSVEWTPPQARKIVSQVEWRQASGSLQDCMVQVEWRLPDGNSQAMVIQIDWNTEPRVYGEVAGSFIANGEAVSGSTVMGEVPTI